jgi:hypothetical protein
MFRKATGAWSASGVPGFPGSGDTRLNYRPQLGMVSPEPVGPIPDPLRALKNLPNAREGQRRCIGLALGRLRPAAATG